MAGCEMGGHQVIADYESLFALTTQMRDAAERGEWDKLVELEQRCSRQVEALKRADATASLDEPARQRKASLIKEILEHDADIRSRTVTWMGQLQHIMQSNRQEQRLQRAYGG